VAVFTAAIDLFIHKDLDGSTPFYAVSVNGLHRNRVRVSVRVMGRVRVMACRPDSSGNLLTRRKMEFARPRQRTASFYKKRYSGDGERSPSVL